MDKNKLTTTFLYILAGISAYMFSLKLSKDWIHYKWMYSLLEKKTWLAVLHEHSLTREPLYTLTIKFLSPCIGFATVIFLATMSLTWIKLNTLEKIVPAQHVSIFFYLCIYWLLLDGTQLRLAYATTFVILSFLYLQNRRYWISLLMIVVASQIQFTTILFSLVFLLYFFQFLNTVIFAIFIAVPALVLFDVSIFSLLEQILSLINPRYLLYGSVKVNGQNSTGLYIYFVAFFWGLLLMLEFRLKTQLQERFKLVLQRLAMIGVICMCIFHDHVALGARLGELLLLPVVLLLSWLYLELVNNKQNVFAHMLTGIFLAYFLARFIYLSN